MKKKLALGIILCLMLSLVACGNSRNDITQSDNISNKPAPSEPSTNTSEPTEEENSSMEETPEETPEVKPDETAGLYDENGNQIKTWEELISSKKITVEGNKLTKVDTTLAGVLKISNTIQIIGEKACYSCASLTGITIPESVTTIEKLGFAQCYALTSIVIPDSVTSMGMSAFNYCSNVTNITLSNNLKSIPDYAFVNCNKVTNIVIPDSVTSIGMFAFNCCAGLKNITIPASVSNIGASAFSGAINKDTVYVKAGSYAEKYMKENFPETAYLKYISE